MRNWNSLLLQTTACVLDPAAHAGIMLRKSQTADQEQRTTEHENKSLANYPSFIHISSNATAVLNSAGLLLTERGSHKVGRNTLLSSCFGQQDCGGNVAGEVSY